MHLQYLDNKNKTQIDFVLVTVPWTDSSMPLMAPAALKPVIEQEGLSCLAIDLNAEIFDYTKTASNKDSLIQFFFNGYTDSEAAATELEELFVEIANRILSYRPKYVGLSIFSYVCQHSAKWIAYFLKKLDPDLIVLVGGAGCLNTFTGPSEFVDELKNLNLIDYHIRGDAEHSLAEFLRKNKTFHGINSLTWSEMSNDEIRSLPIPDYDDYIFDFYTQKTIPLVGSRGCVRRCTFCDYIANWHKFTWRDADSIFSEMLFQNKKYKVNKFKFQDSLTNGSISEFRKLTKLLATHNKDNPNNEFRWSGYYIFRDVNNTSDSDWELIYKSGAEVLMVGIENLNQHIRYDIGKKFSNESIIYHLEKAQQYKIKISMLNIVGYVTETRSDIEYIKQWLRDNTRFKDNIVIQWGGTLGIFPNTYLEKNKDRLGISMIGNGPPLWINKQTGSTPSMRASWAKELNDFSKRLGYSVHNNIDNHYLLEMLMQNEQV
jgi:hypothetical protein